MSRWSLVLASASPARRRLLQAAGIEPLVYPSDFDESQVQLTDPQTLVQTLARCKAEAILPRLRRDPPAQIDPDRTVVLACDSVLAIQGQIYGKPENAQDGIARWQRMRGQVGELYTGHALFELTGDRQICRCGMTKVHFAQPTDAQIAAYIATGEPLNCAGGFAIEGRGGFFIEGLQGCYSNVIGLSLPLLEKMLSEIGVDIGQFWC